MYDYLYAYLVLAVTSIGMAAWVMRRYLLDDAGNHGRRIDHFLKREVPVVPISLDRADRVVRQVCGAPTASQGEADHRDAARALVACSQSVRQGKHNVHSLIDLRARMRIAARLKPAPLPEISTALADEVRILVRADVAIRPLAADELGGPVKLIADLVDRGCLARQGAFGGQPLWRTTALGRERYTLHILALPAQERTDAWVKEAKPAQAALAKCAKLA